MFDFSILQQWAEVKPTEIAYQDSENQLNFAEFNSFTKRFAHFLRNKGIGEQNLVNIYLPSFLNWSGTLAAHMLGAITMCEKQVSQSLPLIIPDFHISISVDPAIGESKTILIDAAILEEIKKTTEIDAYPSYESEDQIARLISTSGTTGNKKFISITAGELEATAIRQGSWNLAGQGINLSLFPLGSKQAYRNALQALRSGNTFYYNDFSDYRLAKLLRRHKINTVFGSPLQFSNLMDVIEHTGTELPHLKSVVIGGATPNVTLINRIKKHLDCKIYNAFGSTEAGNLGLFDITQSNDFDLFDLNQNTIVEIVDEEGTLLPQNEYGFIRYKSPDMAQGYFKNQEMTKKFFKNGFFYTGDIGRIVSNNRLELGGRADDVLNLDGVKVNAGDLDRIALAQLGVLDAAAFGVQNDKGVTQLAYALVVDSDFDLDFFGKVMHKKMPHKIEYIYKLEFLPRNEVGKLLRNELAELHAHPAIES